jgi:hypothetical protein
MRILPPFGPLAAAPDCRHCHHDAAAALRPRIIKPWLASIYALGQAVTAPLAHLGITLLEGLGGVVITPTLMGHPLTINPLLVFLSIAVWNWMWGPVGAFLAVPILRRSRAHGRVVGWGFGALVG